ncbi:MAG: glycosyl hydrolase [Acidobacteriota bacterium]
MLRPALLSLLLALLLTPVSLDARATASTDAATAADDAVDARLLHTLAWREVGPYRGGRAAAVAGVRGNRDVYYFGATGGGVWKTEDAGGSWTNISDGTFGGSIGAVAVAPSDPNVLYVGEGEKTVRGNVSHGAGIWKSTDAGRSWTHVGLEESRHVPRIRIDPRDPNRVYVAALGNLYAPNSTRGVYRSTDGGASWERVLHVNDDAGAVDLVIDPTNPRVLYASLWRVRRTPWSLESGGEGSCLWTSTDGGDTWTELTGNPGLPSAPIGIIGVAVAADPDVLYTIVEAEDGGVFRSDDRGATWRRVNQERALRQRAWYYTRIYADPQNVDTVYVLNVRFHRSTDGGRSFERIWTPHVDNHDLWIDPDDSQRMIESNDGGANVSEDGGATWTRQDNQPTAQMYRVSTDNAFPYHLLGGQQDNTAVRIRHRSGTGAGVSRRSWSPTAGGESGHIVAKPDQPEIVYGGSYGGYLERRDHRTGARRAIHVWPDDPMGWGAESLRYRFQWNFPIFTSPHDPDRLYAAANVLFRSEDEGQSWTAISPDLTRDDKTKMGPSGGPITKDNTGVEVYGTIFAAFESPHAKDLLWAGSDDGRVHISRDGGANWTDITPAALPEWSQINGLDPHPTEAGGAYVAATRYKLGDFRPYLFKTADYGASWTQIDDGIPVDAVTRALRADPDRAGLLYAGTERNGVYVSFDDGARWQSLQRNLPLVPITDLAVKNGDLVAATQGRGYWILDDLSPLHHLDDDVRAILPPADDNAAVDDAADDDAADAEANETVPAARLLPPRTAHRLIATWGDRTPGPRGEDPPRGVVLHYVLGGDVPADATFELAIVEDDGDVVRRFVREADDDAKPNSADRHDPSAPIKALSPEAGLQHVVWDLRYPGMRTFEGLVLWNGRGARPTAVPGTYRARLTVGDAAPSEVTFTVAPDPRSAVGVDAMRAQFDFVIAVRDLINRIHATLDRSRDVRSQLDAWSTRLAEADDASSEDSAVDEAEAEKETPHGAAHEACTTLHARLEALEAKLYQTRNRSPQDPLNFPIQLNDKLAYVMRLAASGEDRPPDAMRAVYDDLRGEAETVLAEFETVWTTDLPAVEAQLAAADLPRVNVAPMPEE